MYTKFMKNSHIKHIYMIVKIKPGYIVWPTTNIKKN